MNQALLIAKAAGIVILGMAAWVVIPIIAAIAVPIAFTAIVYTGLKMYEEHKDLE